MSYYVTGEVIKMDIRVPKDRVLEILDIYPEDEPVSVSSEGITLRIDEQCEGDVITLQGNNYVFNRTNVPHLGGNHSLAEDFFIALAKKFNGTFEARFSGEDGRTWAAKVVEGVQKKVKVVIVEE